LYALASPVARACPPYTVRAMNASTAGAEAKRYGRAAGLLSVGVGIAGLLTYVFFALASHTLDGNEYGEIVVLWSAVFITVSTLFRPVEQLLSRTIAEREAHGQPIHHPLRVAAAIQLALALAFAAAGLALRGPLEDDLLSGDATLYWVLIGAVLGFGASLYARGFLAGSRRFAVYSLLVVVEAVARVAFAFVVAVGIANGEHVVALGVAAAPVLSLVVVPLALRSRPTGARVGGADMGSAVPEFTLAHGGGFAAAVLLIMLSEQTIMNAGVLLVRAAEDAAAAGFIFNVLLIARAPLVLFQAVATSLLPHLTRLLARGEEAGRAAFGLSVRVTVIAIAALAGIVALAVLAAGPQLMQLAFGKNFEYDRPGLLIMTAGMGLYLSAATLNQAALAQGQARRAAACFALCALLFVGWNLLPIMDEFRRVETGFAGAAALLCALLYVIYRRPRARPGDVPEPGSAAELELELAAADEAS
jgi:O-antigen/teichoic acid export membrane protein